MKMVHRIKDSRSTHVASGMTALFGIHVQASGKATGERHQGQKFLESYRGNPMAFPFLSETPPTLTAVSAAAGLLKQGDISAGNFQPCGFVKRSL